MFCCKTSNPPLIISLLVGYVAVDTLFYPGSQGRKKNIVVGSLWRLGAPVGNVYFFPEEIGRPHLLAVYCTLRFFVKVCQGAKKNNERLTGVPVDFSSKAFCFFLFPVVHISAIGGFLTTCLNVVYPDWFLTKRDQGMKMVKDLC